MVWERKERLAAYPVNWHHSTIQLNETSHA
jgi:hypothetical protein